ncbi:hypothetical protein CDAR_175171 [Caerostris darwini]|uniref:Uncharacterized protein n=1 Tax=Caerostris darwini TaxID=1538125 RepID=A0AAV4VYP7_9ARAC|nr:hypothetical protein CDAR_175171 [Caerostris darwini]
MRYALLQLTSCAVYNEVCNAAIDSIATMLLISYAHLLFQQIVNDEFIFYFLESEELTIQPPHNRPETTNNGQGPFHGMTTLLNVHNNPPNDSLVSKIGPALSPHIYPPPYQPYTCI